MGALSDGVWSNAEALGFLQRRAATEGVLLTPKELALSCISRRIPRAPPSTKGSFPLIGMATTSTCAVIRLANQLLGPQAALAQINAS